MTVSSLQGLHFTEFGKFGLAKLPRCIYRNSAAINPVDVHILKMHLHSVPNSLLATLPDVTNRRGWFFGYACCRNCLISVWKRRGVNYKITAQSQESPTTMQGFRGKFIDGDDKPSADRQIHQLLQLQSPG